MRRSVKLRGLALIWSLAALAGVIPAGCGYTLNHRLIAVFQDPRGIFVPTFDNDTPETGVERIFTDALIREILSRRQIKMTSRQEGALELRGKLVAIDVTTMAQSDLGFQGLQSYRRLPSELGVRVRIGLSLRDPGTSKVLWEKEFSGFRRVNAPLDRTFDYQAPSTLGHYTQSLWESQYPEIARLIMRDVYDEMVDLL